MCQPVFPTLLAMAGTLGYRIRVRHIYQQRFGEADKLAQALGDCRWYIISRRAPVRIVPGSAVLDDDILTLDVTTQLQGRSPLTVQVGADLADLAPTRNFTTHPDGSYFSFNAGEQLIHGDAWALASLLSDAREEFARQEVLYVGMAFGQSTQARTASHQKLQQIYAEHPDGDWDIFVAALALERHTWIGDDHIEDAEEGPDMDAAIQHFLPQSGKVSKAVVDLVEHSLVSYFVPYYNEKLVEWRADAPTEAMRKMRDAGFRLLTVHLDGWDGLARFYTPQEPARVRSHFISQDLPPPPRRPVLRGISTTDLSSHRLEAHAVRHGQEIFASRAEASGTVLSIFGDQAPSVRRPADFLAPDAAEDDTAGREAPRLTALRKELLDQRVERLRPDAPVDHPGRSHYDSAAGTIEIGEVVAGDQVEPWLWRLHSPAGQVEHGLIFGDAGAGKSNQLRVILLEAALSEVFFVVPADPRNEHGSATMWRGLADQSWISTSVSDTINNLDRLANIIRARHDSQHFERPTSEVPGILMAIDDADDVLADPHAAARAIEIVRTGPLVGVGLVLVIRDSATFEEHRELGRLLIELDNVVAMPDLAILDDVRAICSEPRPATLSAAPATFVVHWNSSHVRLSQLAGPMTDNTASPEAACEWAEQLLSGVGRPTIGWNMVDGDDWAWETFDLHARNWVVRRHADCWAIFHTFADHPAPSPPTQRAAIDWANNNVAARFHVPPLRWLVGPSTGEPGMKALYADTPHDPEPKPGVTPAELVQWFY